MHWVRQLWLEVGTIMPHASPWKIKHLMCWKSADFVGGISSMDLSLRAKSCDCASLTFSDTLVRSYIRITNRSIDGINNGFDIHSPRLVLQNGEISCDIRKYHPCIPCYFSFHLQMMTHCTVAWNTGNAYTFSLVPKTTSISVVFVTWKQDTTNTSTSVSTVRTITIVPFFFRIINLHH